MPPGAPSALVPAPCRAASAKAVPTSPPIPQPRKNHARQRHAIPSPAFRQTHAGQHGAARPILDVARGAVASIGQRGRVAPAGKRVGDEADAVGCLCAIAAGHAPELHRVRVGHVPGLDDGVHVVGQEFVHCAPPLCCAHRAAEGFLALVKRTPTGTSEYALLLESP